MASPEIINYIIALVAALMLMGLVLYLSKTDRKHR